MKARFITRTIKTNVITVKVADVSNDTIITEQVNITGDYKPTEIVKLVNEIYKVKTDKVLLQVVGVESSEALYEMPEQMFVQYGTIRDDKSI